ncbi:Hypothetical protein NTJ_06054 [Nesidiocoris tenuis]|uniref:Uncharacterized protein n=1 Tax=Nesidiocoris tenuis TaxID=355587 RepID=A0ABN7ALY4_9HEMI|nr:Hypothetical protein NTJ_06054 [Nesidiocoris tenuis]
MRIEGNTLPAGENRYGRGKCGDTLHRVEGSGCGRNDSRESHDRVAVTLVGSLTPRYVDEPQRFVSDKALLSSLSRPQLNVLTWRGFTGGAFYRRNVTLRYT